MIFLKDGTSIFHLGTQKLKNWNEWKKIEEEKSLQIYTNVENWQRAEHLRKFMEAKKEDEISKGTFNKETEIRLAWVTTKINDLDPLQN